MKSNENNSPQTLIEAVRYFSDLDIAHAFFVRVRWPHEVCCPHCGSTAVRYLAKYRRFQCSHNHPRRQFTVKTGTVMEDSPLGLDKWAVAFWLECNAKNSISSYELHRALKVTQKSAWFMLHRIRLALQDGSIAKMSGIVEADETYIGGAAHNVHAWKKRKNPIGPGGAGKAMVMGILNRGGEVRATVMQDRTGPAMHEVIRTHVEPGTHLYTDNLKTYRRMSPEYVHRFVDHTIRYVDGAVHTNGLENFWALFKRCIKGTHISVEPFHLQAYLDSEIFRFNQRKITDGERFMLGLQGMSGKRLTYKSLIGDTSPEALAANDKNAASQSRPN